MTLQIALTIALFFLCLAWLIRQAGDEKPPLGAILPEAEAMRKARADRVDRYMLGAAAILFLGIALAG